MRDKVLKTLLDKKIELLEKLLRCSQLGLTVTDELDLFELQRERATVLSLLIKNDDCISVREQELKSDYDMVDSGRSKKIKSIIETIQYNNDHALKKVQLEKVQLNQERKSFGNTSRLSGYISTQKSFQTFKPIIPKVNKNILEPKSSKKLLGKMGFNRYIRGKNENKSIAR